MLNSPEAWVQDCLDHLEEYRLAWTGEPGVDGWNGETLELSTRSGRWPFRLHCRSQLRPTTIDYMLTNLLAETATFSMSTPTLVLTEQVTKTVAERLRERGVSYLDAAGNAWLQQPGLFLWVQGRKGNRAEKTSQKIETLTALQLTYLLLKSKAVVARPYRELARNSHLALGTVGWIMAALERAGYVVKGGRRRRLKRPAELHARWEESWHEKLRPKLNATQCKAAPDPGFRRLLDACIQERQWLVGGELAAAQILGGLQPESTTLHVPPGSVRKCMKDLRLLPHPEGNVRVLETFGDANGWEQAQVESKPAWADPLLIRAELLEVRDERVHAMATDLLTKEIQPRWEN